MNRFYQPWAEDKARLDSELSSLRLQIVVRLDSGSFLGSRHGDSARSVLLEARLGLLKVRLSSRLGLSQLGDRLSTAQLDSLFGARLISARSSGWA